MSNLEPSNQTPAKGRDRFSGIQKFYIAAACAFVISFLIGAKYGEMTSSNISTEGQAIVYLANNIRLIDDGAAADVTLRLDSGVIYYVYSLKDDKVHKHTASLLEVRGKALPRSALSKKELDSFRELAQLIAPTAVATAGAAGVLGALQKANEVTRPLTTGTRIVAYVVGGVIAVSGGYLGYLLTYSDAPQFDENGFRKTIEDPGSWRSFAISILRCNLLLTRDEINQTMRDKAQKTTEQLDGEPVRAVDPAEHQRCTELKAALKSPSRS